MSERALIGLEEARAIVLERTVPLAAEEVALAHALGRVLAADVVSPGPVPAFDNSAMDGYAVRAEDLDAAAGEAAVLLRVVGESRAGHPAEGGLGPGEAIAISTGAAIPDGADAVVRVEDTSPGEGGVQILRPVPTGANVRRAGEDIRAGETVLTRGVQVGPFELGVLASIVEGSVGCATRPRVGMLFTGDELTQPGDPATAGSVRNTNAFVLPALARLAGAHLERVSTVGDDRAATRGALERLRDCDVVVVCGGVSVGSHDHVRPALEDLGARQLFWGIALRPGRPTWFGELASSGAGPTLVFGLPGNPVSALVTFLLLVRPCLRALSGADPAATRITAVLDAGYEKPPGRTHAVRCLVRAQADGWHATTTGPQGSHVLTSMLGADGLAMIPAESHGIGAGEPVTVELLPALSAG